MRKGQGALEYLIIITAVLAISAVIVLFLTGAFGGQQKAAMFAQCKQAAINCKNTKLLTPDDPCTICETQCEDLQGNDLIAGMPTCEEGSACWYCKQGRPDEIYERPLVTCTDGETRSCTTAENCPGTQTCTAGTWGSCVDVPDDNCPEVNQPPIANITKDPDISEGAIPFTIRFSSSYSTDPDGTIVDRLWEVIKNQQVIHTETTVWLYYTFTEPGLYTIKLTVTDDDGAIDIAYDYITATSPAVMEISEVRPNTTSVGQNTYFNITASDLDGITSCNICIFADPLDPEHCRTWKMTFLAEGDEFSGTWRTQIPYVFRSPGDVDAFGRCTDTTGDIGYGPFTVITVT